MKSNARAIDRKFIYTRITTLLFIATQGLVLSSRADQLTLR